MRILHLAYEDPKRPGSGGGSVRTREIDRRLAERHEVTAVVASYPGARSRVEDGVRWVPIGPGFGETLPRLAYFGLAGAAVLRHPADVVVEDFGAPFSVALSPLFARTPVVASVQWLFAREMREKYGLPFDLVQDAGLRLYHDFITVSDWLADEIRSRRPAARIETIPNGIESDAFRAVPSAPEHLLFVGRLDTKQKGADLLVEVARLLAERLGPAMPPLLIAGDGPDRAEIERRAAAAGVAERVRFLGRVEGDAKYDLMARSHAVLMPSRFETFGMVAVEAQAAGVPVVAFDVGPLREVAGPGGARLVTPFDTSAFAAEVASLVTDPARRAALGLQGRAWAERYDWDAIAGRVEAHLEETVEADRAAKSQPRRPPIIPTRTVGRPRRRDAASRQRTLGGGR